jgi:threonylcarbamoyladenosine tRNA methylthiotransferase MtaB
VSEVLDRPDVEVVSFGCRLNAYEGEQARARARADGLTDAVIVNTCAVTEEAVRQAGQAIRRARRARPDARLIVTGCAAQIEPERFAAMAEVDAVLGNALKSAPGAYAADAFFARVRLGELDAVRAVAPHLAEGAESRSRAHVEVQNGCDHRCTFCVIPYGRGPSRSAAAGDVVARVRAVVAEGRKEAVLTGVDLTSWGADLPGRPTLGQLVARILKLVPELPRLRLSSIDAAEIDADLLRCFADEPRLMPHLHLSLQSGDDMILKRMKRRHTAAQALALIEAVRAVRPETAFGADLIAGFPTEDDAMAENTRRFVRDAGLAYLHVFPFSPRPHAPAAHMPQLPRAVVKARAQALRAEADAALDRHLAAQMGREVSCLVEKPDLARAEDFGEVEIAAAAPDEILRVRITSRRGRRLVGAAV